MDVIGVAILVTSVAGIGILVRHRYRQRLQITHHGVLCPIHESQAEVAVQTDPRAQSCQQYVEVARCSLLSDLAVALPERTGYLPDVPPWRVRWDAARSFPVYAAKVSCRQPCVFVLNTTAVCATSQPLTCTSGATDAMELAQQAIRNPRISRLFWSSS